MIKKNNGHTVGSWIREEREREGEKVVRTNEVVKFEVWWLCRFCFEVSSMCLYLTSFLFYSSIWWQQTKMNEIALQQYIQSIEKNPILILLRAHTHLFSWLYLL